MTPSQKKFMEYGEKIISSPIRNTSKQTYPDSNLKNSLF